jgi:ADP-heptose:LPS heptosyltransferase
VIEASGQRPRLVALRALGLGDFLCGLPALRALTSAFARHERLLAAPAVLRPLAELSRCGFCVVDAGPLQRLPARLDRPQVAVNLHGSGPQSHRRLLETRPGCLIGFSHPAVPESAGSPDWRREEHEVQRWCRLLVETGIPADPGALHIDASRLDSPAPFRDALVLHPGASSRARQWPPERWAAVAREQRDAGRHVVITGGAGERRLALEVAREAGVDPTVVLSGRTTLLQLTALVAAARLVVCGDTGVAHLATALGTPSVILFGPTSPTRWGPPPSPRHLVLWNGTTGDPHGAEPDAGLLAIGVGDVLEAIEDVANTADRSGSKVLR